MAFTKEIVDFSQLDNIEVQKKLLNNLFCKSKCLLFCKQYKKIKTPNQVEIEVAMGIIKNPILLKKLTLIITFKKTINVEI